MNKKILFLGLILMIFLAGCSEKVDNKIYVVTMTPANMRAELLAGNIDGFIAWEPFNADVVVNDFAKYLLKSDEIWPEHPCCVLATITTERDTIKALIWAHIKATEFIKNPKNKEKVIQYAMEFTGRDRNVIEEALKNIKFVEIPDKNEFKKYYDNLKKTDLLINTPEKIGYKDDDEFFSDFLYLQYYEEVSKKMNETPNWTPLLVEKEVKIGYLTADLHELAVYVAQKEGYYDAVFKNIKFLQFPKGPDAMNAFKAGLIDASYLGGAPATLKRINEDIPIKIIAGANDIGSALVVRKDINSVKDLAGKTIATPGFGTVQDLILRMIAEQNNLEVVVKK